MIRTIPATRYTARIDVWLCEPCLDGKSFGVMIHHDRELIVAAISTGRPWLGYSRLPRGENVPSCSE